MFASRCARLHSLKRDRFVCGSNQPHEGRLVLKRVRRPAAKANSRSGPDSFPAANNINTSFQLSNYKQSQRGEGFAVSGSEVRLNGCDSSGAAIGEDRVALVNRSPQRRAFTWILNSL